MKFVTLFSLFLLSGCLSSGKFIQQFPFENHFVVGEGNSPEEARKNALGATPDGYTIDQYPLMFLGCVDPNEHPLWNETKNEMICPSGKYQSQIELTSLNQNELADLAKKRARPAKEITGFGETYEEAKADLLKKIPQNAILSPDSMSFICKEKDFWVDKKYKSICDDKIYLNKHVVRVYALQPNADKVLE